MLSLTERKVSSLRGETLPFLIGGIAHCDRRHRNTPIGDIGTSDEVYLKQMRALIDLNEGFNWVNYGL